MDTKRIVQPASEQTAPFIRIVQIDVLRGYALLGIYWINVIVFGLPTGIYAVPNIIGAVPEWNIAFWAFSEFYVEGTMRGLFSILFGASALVFLDEAKLATHGTDLVDRFYRRNMLLIAFGMLHGYLLLWPYDVLYAYGLIGMFLFPLRRIKPHTLLIIGLVILLIGEMDIRNTINQYQWDQTIYSSTENNLIESEFPVSGIDEETRRSILSSMQDDIEDHMTGYYDLFILKADLTMVEETIKMYTTHIFDIGGMMLIGMGLLKLGILSGQRSRRFYLLLMLLGYGIGLAVRGYIIYRDINIGFNPELAIQNSAISYNFGRLPVTLGHIGLIGLLCKINFFDPFTRLLAKMGRMALTNYVMQSVISVLLFYGIGLGLYGQFEHYQLMFVCLGVWTFQIAISAFWLKHFKQGPLEWLWRSLIYGQIQPLRRHKQANT